MSESFSKTGWKVVACFWTPALITLLIILFLLTKIPFRALLLGFSYPHLIVNVIQSYIMLELLKLTISSSQRFREIYWIKHTSYIISLFTIVFIVVSSLEVIALSTLLSTIQALIITCVSYYAVVIPIVILKRRYGISVRETRIYTYSSKEILYRLSIIVAILWILLVIGLYMGFLGLPLVYYGIGYRVSLITIIALLVFVWFNVLGHKLFAKKSIIKELFPIAGALLLTSYCISSLIENIFYTTYAVLVIGLIEVLTLYLLLDGLGVIFRELTTLQYTIYGKLVPSDIELKFTPRIISIEYDSRRYSLYRKELAIRVADALIDLFGRTTTPSAVVIVTWPGSFLQEYLIGNLYMYFAAETPNKQPVIHLLNVFKGAGSTIKSSKIMEGILRHDIGFDPVHTAYLVEKIKYETGRGPILLVIEDVIGLLLTYHLERVYEVIYSVVRKLERNDLVVILVPRDLVGIKALYALRNLASGLLYL